ncbi:SGNH hydrolase [Dictyobacter alpinus]|uniref:SGNH hydrolase n=1 Tax=Dictyobacter alpinus TaxID=2014873 RepID=A0A402BB74_9CHLR|nr:GDSL-type esterase/lipase family protein [Dictyobacter alpinus]GCE28594.1 SGNH hydrolase [Dictyobacter alpinus]
MDSRGDQLLNWVGTWYAAPMQMPASGLAGRTLRQIVHVSAGGGQVRLRLSNRYGNATVTLRSVSVGLVQDGPVVQAGAQTVLFDGQAMVTLEPGQEVISDPVALRVEALSKLAVSFFVAQGECTTGHMSAQQHSYVSVPGDYSAVLAEAAFLAYPLITTSWWLLSGIDVIPTTPLNAVVALGSSVTDGYGSTPNANHSWPSYLAKRLLEAGGTRRMAVLNAGISGNQLLAAEPAQSLPEIEVPHFLCGEAGRQRLAWDVLGQPGATDLIVHIGSNDLRAGVPAMVLIEAFQQLAQRARQSYHRVFGTTLLPGGYPPQQIPQRQLFNRWMLEQGIQHFDAIFDFAAPLRSAEDESLLNPAYDSGDGVHPNDNGYQLMAAAIDINQLSGSHQGQ